MATPNPASESPSGEGTRNVPRSDSSLDNDPKYRDTFNFFYINLCNIHARCCIYVRNDLTCSCVHALESSESSTIWLQLDSRCLTKFICAAYLSLNSSDYSKFFDYLTSKVEHILSLHPFAEISILGDFSVHHQLWLSSPFIDHPGELVFKFAILHDLQQQVLTRGNSFLAGSPKAEVPLLFCLCQWGDLRRYYVDFPWNDYGFRVRDPPLYAERITPKYFGLGKVNTQTLNIPLRIPVHLGNDPLIRVSLDIKKKII
ncbi:hypothetical protein E2C01_003264 [Portunus trituberculatus]|uniref:Endonuclease/exonuclease/phosphatase domain-containing protein n=1 Tax=Portunus trituberculatus TaxID=210409 RepID=A0A5B7CN92_PORTR|nr:hypothetical protein [Portunus trituberculatus]